LVLFWSIEIIFIFKKLIPLSFFFFLFFLVLFSQKISLFSCVFVHFEFSIFMSKFRWEFLGSFKKITRPRKIKLHCVFIYFNLFFIINHSFWWITQCIVCLCNFMKNLFWTWSWVFIGVILQSHFFERLFYILLWGSTF